MATHGGTPWSKLQIHRVPNFTSSRCIIHFEVENIAGEGKWTDLSAEEDIVGIRLDGIDSVDCPSVLLSPRCARAVMSAIHSSFFLCREWEEEEGRAVGRDFQYIPWTERRRVMTWTEVAADTETLDPWNRYRTKRRWFNRFAYDTLSRINQ